MATGYQQVFPAEPMPVTWTLPTGAIAQTFPRVDGTSATAILTSGQFYFTPIYLRAGQVVTTISVMSGGAVVNPTHQWFALYSSALSKLGVTSDDTTTAWSGAALKSLNLSAAYTVTASGYYLIGIVVVADTPPTLRVKATTSALTGLTPKLAGLSDGSLTDPASAPNTATAITANGNTFYAYVS